jgi:hypothetical protein
MISTWPMFAAAITTAAASAGFKIVREKPAVSQAEGQSLDITMENMEVVSESLSNDKEITVERDGVRVAFSRDARGYFKTCVTGSRSKAELKQIGEELAGHVIQNYVHRRLAEELQARGFVTVNQDQAADKSIHMHVQRL